MNTTTQPTLDHVILTTKADNTIVDICEVKHRYTGTMSPARYRWHKIKTFFMPRTAETAYKSILPHNDDDAYVCYHPPSARRYYTTTYVDKPTAEMWRDIIEVRGKGLSFSVVVTRNDARAPSSG